LAALSRSRSESRRSQIPSSRKSAPGTPRRPISVDPPSSDDSDPESSPSSSRSRASGSPHPDNSGDPDDSSGNEGSSSGHESDSSANSLLSDCELSQLEPTSIPRDQWIPGYRDPVDFDQANVDPWPAPELSVICVRKLTVELLFHKWCRPEFWMFPRREPAPPTTMWFPELITGPSVMALYASKPWEVLDQDVIPRSFNLTGWYEQLSRMYLAFESAFHQVYWEATHKLPITKEMRRTHSYLASLSHERKQRRSHVGPRWKTLLKHILAGIVAGECDLDFFLDPFFLHFPRLTEQSFWYPGLGMNRAPANLDAALTAVDLADPWRNQFRKNLADHPGNGVVRLDNKFRPDAD
jgi:hypothetical protein